MIPLVFLPDERLTGGRGAFAPVGGSLSLSLLVGKVSDAGGGSLSLSLLVGKASDAGKSEPDSGGKSEARRGFLAAFEERGAGLFFVVLFAVGFAAGFFGAGFFAAGFAAG